MGKCSAFLVLIGCVDKEVVCLEDFKLIYVLVFEKIPSIFRSKYLQSAIILSSKKQGQNEDNIRISPTSNNFNKCENFFIILKVKLLLSLSLPIVALKIHWKIYEYFHFQSSYFHYVVNRLCCMQYNSWKTFSHF